MWLLLLRSAEGANELLLFEHRGPSALTET